jgi:hypothetical protein
MFRGPLASRTTRLLRATVVLTDRQQSALTGQYILRRAQAGSGTSLASVAILEIVTFNLT